MILSNVEIHRALDAGQLKIEPEPFPRQLIPGQKCPYQTSSVDLTLGTEVSYIPKMAGLPVNIDLRQGQFANLFAPHAVIHSLSEQQPFILAPGQFVLAKTKEKVTFPLIEGGTVLAGRVEGKSSYARCGLLVHFTAPTIHAGFSGTITLELINFGPVSIGLYPDMPICQLIVEQVLGTPFSNQSQFQGQTQAGGNAPTARP